MVLEEGGGAAPTARLRHHVPTPPPAGNGAKRAQTHGSPWGQKHPHHGQFEQLSQVSPSPGLNSGVDLQEHPFCEHKPVSWVQQLACIAKCFVP